MLGLSLEDWRTVLLGFAGLGQTFFVLLYLTFPWFDSLLGKALFSKAVTLAVLLDVGVAARVLGFTQFNWFWILLYVALAVTIWMQFFAFVEVKLRAMRNGGSTPGHQAVKKL